MYNKFITQYNFYKRPLDQVSLYEKYRSNAMMSKWITLSVMTITVLASIWGCGGGGGGSPAKPPTDEPLNSELDGKIILGSRGWMLDLSTGNYSRVPGVEAWDDNPQYLGIATVRITARAFSGEQIVETVTNCENDPNTRTWNIHCVKIHDSSGDFLKGIYFGKSDIREPVKLSRDGRYLAVVRQYGDSTSNLYLEIHDPVNNDIVDNAVIGRGLMEVSFDWLPDNRIVYAFDQSIYITQSLSSHGTPLIQFEQTDGRPIDLTASPSGDRMAFMLVTFGNTVVVNAYVWTMDSSGNDLKRLAVVPGESNPKINYPTWSPDGKWLLVVEGDVSGSSVISPGAPGDLYAVPSGGLDVPLVLDGTSTTAIPVYSRFGQVLGVGDSNLDTSFLKSGELFWLSKN
jgi:dipeptidyl aminopeptidase/acylaminoacyl peptidase